MIASKGLKEKMAARRGLSATSKNGRLWRGYTWVQIALIIFGISAYSEAQTLHLERLPVTMTRPVALAFAPEDDRRVYIAEASGIVRVAIDGVLRDKPFLDISAKVKQPTPSNGEAGFLSLAFDPNHDKRGNLTLYVHYVDIDNRNVLEMHKVKKANRAVGKPKGAPLLVSQAVGNGHYGGKLNFGPDGALYTSLGDGGDPPSSQDLGSWRGKIVRFGDTGPEIMAYGLRNPWQWSFDRETGDRWIGNVGNSVYESLYFQAFGDTTVPNHGWPAREGTWCSAPCAPEPAGFVPPVLTYYHYAVDPAMSGQCIIGGYVYRGTALPWLVGSYVFADFAGQGKLWAYKDGVVTDLKPLLTTDAPFTNPCAFNEDNDGELWVIDFAGADVFRIVP